MPIPHSGGPSKLAKFGAGVDEGQGGLVEGHGGVGWVVGPGDGADVSAGAGESVHAVDRAVGVLVLLGEEGGAVDGGPLGREWVGPGGGGGAAGWRRFVSVIDVPLEVWRWRSGGPGRVVGAVQSRRGPGEGFGHVPGLAEVVPQEVELVGG